MLTDAARAKASDDHRCQEKVIGFLLIIPIGGARMPVSCRWNSYSGWGCVKMVSRRQQR
jgi:hypothetical protein